MQTLSSTYIGLMSGTSLDGIDGVLVDFPVQEGAPVVLLASAHQVFPPALKQQALALQQSGEDEIAREALFSNELVKLYASCVAQLRETCPTVAVQAIGVHGQTIRHRPELGYTRQSNNPALLAELSGIDVIADFRSRDVAAGGQGAPLVPAFHRAMFGLAGQCRVVVNIGGIANISILHADGRTTGFDTGPGNVLMDAWMQQHHQKPYDENGAWAAQGEVHVALLASLCEEHYFLLVPPKSTGRDLFHLTWLETKLTLFPEIAAVDVQATLLAFTAITIADAIHSHAPDCSFVFVCGGGAYNQTLMSNLERFLAPVLVDTTASLGMSPTHVEALAFAWLAQRFTQRRAGNLPEVTGAKGERILGALYPA